MTGPENLRYISYVRLPKNMAVVQTGNVFNVVDADAYNHGYKNCVLEQFASARGAMRFMKR